jgi:hypothetical protein
MQDSAVDMRMRHGSVISLINLGIGWGCMSSLGEHMVALCGKSNCNQVWLLLCRGLQTVWSQSCSHTGGGK